MSFRSASFLIFDFRSTFRDWLSGHLGRPMVPVNKYAAAASRNLIGSPRQPHPRDHVSGRLSRQPHSQNELVLVLRDAATWAGRPSQRTTREKTRSRNVI